MSALHNLEAEQAVLGAILFENRILAQLALRPEYFYDPVHQRIFAEVARRINVDQRVDALTLRHWADADAGLREIGGGEYLLRLLDSAAPLTVQAIGYAECVRDLAERRAIVATAKQAIAEAEADSANSEAVLGALEQRLQEFAASVDDGDGLRPKGESVLCMVERAELGEAKGISTGFREIDAMIGGLKPALYLLGAASSMGKSTLLSAISRNVAAQGYAVAEFALEMDEMEDGLRSATALAFDRDPKVDSPNYLSAQRGVLRPEQWAALRGAAKASAGLPIYTDWRPGRTVRQIEMAARRLFQKLRRERRAHPGAVVIDHEGLLAQEPGQRFQSQLERTNARAEALLALPKKLGVPVLVAGQLTKEGKRADGDDRLPSMDDWKYGGALIEAAQAVLLVHRKAYYAERKPKHLRSDEDWAAIKSRETTIVVDKARGGRRGQCTLWMDMPSAAVWEDAA